MDDAFKGLIFFFVNLLIILRRNVISAVKHKAFKYFFFENKLASLCCDTGEDWLRLGQCLEAVEIYKKLCLGWTEVYISIRNIPWIYFIFIYWLHQMCKKKFKNEKPRLTAPGIRIPYCGKIHNETMWLGNVIIKKHCHKFHITSPTPQ